MKKAAVITLLVVAVFAGLAVAAVFVIDARLPQYREQLATLVGERIDARVEIDELDLRWGWQGPRLRLSGVRITRPGDAQSELRIPAVGLQFSLLDLARGQRLPDGVILHSPRFQIRLDMRHWQTLSLAGSGNANGFDWARLARIRDALDRIVIDDAELAITLISDAGPHHIRLQQFNATLSDTGNTLQLSASARPDAWVETIELQARLAGTLPNFDTAQLELNAGNLAPLALWHTLAPGTVPKMAPEALSGGTTDLQLSSHWQAGQFDHARLQIDATALRYDPQKPPLLPAIQATFGAQADPDEPGIIHVALDSLTGADPALAPIQASARIDSVRTAITADARNIAASLFAPLAQRYVNGVEQAQFGGSIDAVEVTLSADEPIRAAVAFEQISVTSPRFTTGPVSGHYYRSGSNNVLRFSNAGGEVRVERFMKGALPIADLGGQLSWERSDDALQLLATDLKLSSGASTLTLNGELTLPGEGVPVADLTTHLTTPDCSVLLAHVPQAQDMPFDRLRDWLPKAVESCDVAVDGYLKGPLNQMFADQGKHLGITITGSDFAMEYKPGWPRLTGGAGTIQLEGDTLDITIDQGKMLGVDVGPVGIQVADVREPVLFLDGTVKQGSATKMLSFLAKSPLRDRFGKLVKALDVSGDAGLDLKLRLPLKDGLGEIKVDGTIHASANSISHEALPAPIKSIRGDLHFSRDGLQAKGLQGELMGVALTTRITPAAGGRIDIVSRGRIALPENEALLDKYLPEHWLAFARGSTLLEARLQLDNRGHISGLSLHSDLQGVALTLPRPLRKTPDTARAFELQIKQGGQLALRYGDDVRVAMQFDDHRLQRAVIRLGAGATSAPPARSGLWLGGAVDTLPAIAWTRTLRTLLDGGKNNKSKTDDATGLPFLGADLAIGTLRIGNRQVNNVRIKADRLTQASGWKIAVNGAGAVGKATWRPTDGQRHMLRAHLSQLHIQTLETTPATSTTSQQQPDSTLTDYDPRGMPALNVTIDQLRVGDTRFGSARIEATALDDGWRLDQALLSGGALSLTASGDWTRHVGLTRASLDIRIEGQGLAGLVQALGYDPAIRAQQASIQAALKITPNDHGLNLGALNGTLSLTLTDGALQSIEPGAGRLLGLLNLYVLPRRLMLDFSDVVNKGLAFDRISGNFEIISGDAFTDNLVIQTPAAKIRIVGRVGLAARDYDQTVTIVPKFGSSLTLAGTVLGGPAVGAAVFALQQLLQTPLQNASSITYQLQGSWEQPKIVDPRAEK